MRVSVRSSLVLALSLMVTACGKKGALIYPDMMVPAAPTAATAQQSGTIVKLQFTLPDKDRGGRSLKGLAGMKISKRVNESAKKDVCRSCMTDYTQFQALYLDHIPDSTRRIGNRIVLLDNDVNVGYAYSYALAPFTGDGADGSVSTTADVHVTSALPAPVLSIESLPTEVILRVSSPLFISGKMLGYNIYRRVDGIVKSPLPINSEPISSNEYVDTGIERGVTYRYSVRSLVVMESGSLVESYESQEVEGMLKDDE